MGFGKSIVLTTFGESHGPAMGGILEGLPSNLHIDLELLQQHVDRRRPGIRHDTSQRKESDKVNILSGLSRNFRTLGTPIGFLVKNEDGHSEDYENQIGIFRPNHAEYSYYKKYGIVDFRGGGRASARETVSWVIAGALCCQWLEKYGIRISAVFIETNSVQEAAARGDSTGGIVKGRIEGLPAGLGEPVFDKFHSRLAAAMMTINAAKAFEYGDGVESAYKYGSVCQDKCIDLDNNIFDSNHSGGILGGISNGMPVDFKVYFKPTPTIFKPTDTIDIDGQPCILTPKGRHDPCVAIRAVPIVEAMAWLVTADFIKLAGRII